MRAKKVDTTHGEVFRALRAASVRVADTSSVGRGYPDLHCSYRGFSALVEVKSPKGKLNELQRDFVRDWEGPVIVARDGEEAVSQYRTSGERVDIVVSGMLMPTKGGSNCSRICWK